MTTLRLGLIGAGIFARDVHVPALLELCDVVEIAAVWSRTRANAESLAERIGGETGSKPVVAETVDELLAVENVEVVDIVLPIDSQPAVVRKAWTAGKHVVSEKPIASTVEEARGLVEEWRKTGVQWMVAENWRYESAFVAARETMASGAIGRPITVSWTLHAPANPALPYYHTAWRRSGAIPGGFLLDAGVHHAAVFREVVGEVQAVQAFVMQHNPEIPPADTLAATLHFENGAVGSYVASYAQTASVVAPLLVVGTEGIVRAGRGYIEIERDGKTERREFHRQDGVGKELEAFFTSLRGGASHINTPEEALRDLAIIEAMLKSAATGVCIEVPQG